ncbi:MAG: hypothetical protein AAGB00_13235 [Planctomycetota bacterium]
MNMEASHSTPLSRRNASDHRVAKSHGEAGRGKAAQARDAFAELLGAASARGFYGSVSLTLTVQDGHIQHVKVATERAIR